MVKGGDAAGDAATRSVAYQTSARNAIFGFSNVHATSRPLHKRSHRFG